MAWDIPDFSLKGQPGISETWADGIADARKDKRARDEADALKLGRQQAVSSAHDADGRFDVGKATDSLLRLGDFEGAKAVSGLAAPALPGGGLAPAASARPAANRTPGGIPWRIY